jgi:hypothetical protein
MKEPTLERRAPQYRPTLVDPTATTSAPAAPQTRPSP